MSHFKTRDYFKVLKQERFRHGRLKRLSRGSCSHFMCSMRSAPRVHLRQIARKDERMEIDEKIGVPVPNQDEVEPMEYEDIGCGELSSQSDEKQFTLHITLNAQELMDFLSHQNQVRYMFQNTFYILVMLLLFEEYFCKLKS